MEFSFDPFTLLIAFVSIVLAISIHEMMHAYTGLKLGDTTAHEQGRISLNPLAHIDPFMTIALPLITLILFQLPILAAKPVPFNPDRVRWDEFGAALIAAAGPFTNLALAAIGAGLAHLLGASGDIFTILEIWVSINIALFVFNLIPIPPLDGSRILYAFAPDSVRGIMDQLEQFGIILIFALILLVPVFGQMIYNLNVDISRWLLLL